MEVPNVFPTVSSSRSSINISWTVPKKCLCYKVKYREFSDQKTFQVESTFECQIIIRNLKCKTVYEIKVYIEDEDGIESCLFSTEAQTTESSAIWLTELADKITDDPIPVYQLRATTEKEIGNEKKVKVYEYFPEKDDSEERTLILVGAIGSGKSTLINAMINFVADVSYAERFRLKIVDDKHQSSIISSTNNVTCFKIRWQNGFRIGYNLNIVEVPGFDKTTQKEGTYSNIIQQLLDLFESGEVQFIDAVCLVVPSLCRLTEDHRCLFNDILSLFGKDIKYVIPLITFDDGGNMVVLNSLKNADVPFLEYLHFSFNNSMLYDCSESPATWNKREDNINNLFGRLLPSMKKSLDETKKVLLNHISRMADLNQAENKIREKDMIITSNDSIREVNQNKERNKNKQIFCTNCEKCNVSFSNSKHFSLFIAWILEFFFKCPVVFWCFYSKCECNRLFCFHFKCLQRLIGCQCSCAITHHYVDKHRHKGNIQQCDNSLKNSNQNIFDAKLRGENGIADKRDE